MPTDLALCLTLICSNYPCLEHIHGSKGVRAIEVRLYSEYKVTDMLKDRRADVLKYENYKNPQYLSGV